MIVAFYNNDNLSKFGNFLQFFHITLKIYGLTISKSPPPPPGSKYRPTHFPFHILCVYKSVFGRFIIYPLCYARIVIQYLVVFFLHNDLESISQAPPFLSPPRSYFLFWRIFCCYLISYNFYVDTFIFGGFFLCNLNFYVFYHCSIMILYFSEAFLRSQDGFMLFIWKFRSFDGC